MGAIVWAPCATQKAHNAGLPTHTTKMEPSAAQFAGKPELGDFHVMIEVKDLAQLDMAFDHVAERSEPTESFHFGVNSLVQNVRFALYRDFPDQQRQRGAERF